MVIFKVNFANLWFFNFAGNGDMAVSNSIGSNIFDILLCLGLPWFLHSIVIAKGQPVTINSRGILFTSCTMLGTVVFLLLAVSCNKWRLNKHIGIVFFVVYFIVIVFACLWELNVFMVINLPLCEELWTNMCLFLIRLYTFFYVHVCFLKSLLYSICVPVFCLNKTHIFILYLQMLSPC